MPYRVPTVLNLSEAERAELEGWARRRKTAETVRNFVWDRGDQVMAKRSSKRMAN
jgi:hypothetical protein